MYKKFFGLKENPFNVNPDPRYLFLTPHTQEALACLTYGIETRKGFILLTGEVGTGKTTLINKLLEWLHKERVFTAFVFNPRLSVSQFFDFMMADFGIACESHQKGQMLLKLNQWLLDRYRAGERAVLIVDEAQNLSPQMLEEIRLLTNLETSTEKLLQIVLAGQPELEQKLNQPDLRQLRQRITLRAKTRQLTLEETQGYIEERLRIAGSENPYIFTPEAVAMVHRYARGIPRVTNLLCEHALVSSFADEKNPVQGETVEEVARDFDLHIVDPLAQPPAPANPLATASAPGTNGSQPPVIESLLQAINTLVDRLNQAEARVESDPEHKT
jgi:general secretion pathway protein A